MNEYLVTLRCVLVYNHTERHMTFTLNVTAEDWRQAKRTALAIAEDLSPQTEFKVSGTNLVKIRYVDKTV